MVPLHVVILAAGEGTRMRSDTPKVLHPLLGRPMVGHVIAAAGELGAETIVLVVSPNADPLRAAFARSRVVFAVQDPPRGTGDAAACGLAAIDAAGPAEGLVLIINGDCPCIQAATLRRMIDSHADADGTFLSVVPKDPTGAGRFIRDTDGNLSRIVEEADASGEDKALGEVNAGVYLFNLSSLRQALSSLRPDNLQGEIYLTDTLEVIQRQGGGVRIYQHDDPDELQGVNTRVELARTEELLRRRKLEELMLAGVTVRDPGSTFVDVGVSVGNDTVLYSGVTLEAGTTIGSRCTLYPNVRIARTRVDDEVTVLDGTVVEDSVIERGARLGPYARLRPGAHICEGAAVGNFVEVKATRLGKGSKAGHLSYLGNADIGAGVNIGAGTITCNYDGVDKHTTVIADGAFIGSNTALVAPVRIGAGAYVGAGSTITKDVPDRALGVARGRQVVKEGWAEQHATAARKRRR